MKEIVNRTPLNSAPTKLLYAHLLSNVLYATVDLAYNAGFIE